MLAEQGTGELERWTEQLKNDIAAISRQFVELQTFYQAMGQQPGQPGVSDKTTHADQMLKTLQRRFAGMSADYRASLAARADLLRLQKQRREIYGDQLVLDNSLPSQSSEPRQRLVGPATSPYGATSETAIDMPIGLGMDQQLQMQTQLVPSTLATVDLQADPKKILTLALPLLGKLLPESQFGHREHRGGSARAGLHLSTGGTHGVCAGRNCATVSVELIFDLKR